MLMDVVSVQWMNPYTLIDVIEFENSWTLAIQLEVCKSNYSNMVELLTVIALY